MEKEDQSLWNLHLKSLMYSLGSFTYAVGGPIMIAGFFHGFAKGISNEYLKIMSKYPSGEAIFLIGLGIRLIGNSMIGNSKNDNDAL